ncbi:polyketide cyclase/dehydrase/lipid transport superfamily protein [Perilla frutescens var. hirtella]|nr:polyketide cyclase/dehydrase/lipid transport superfamily protein [Perilla frutescens var. hirtella]KAH6807522.1 polyketide cyclase/dehydrase/lipid transport superfamily protein [Perilla frutescens var. frutescens]
MDGKGTIADYRSKMDKTLASHDLTNDEKLETLVRNQILQSSTSQFEGYIENVVERRSKELSNFLGMLRSTALVNDVERSKSTEESSVGWKVKQDTEEFRVMYREGPEGTPFHTLLVEGYVDGPLDVCLCISWESTLYNKWWPQTAIPTFKIISSRCLQRFGAGEQISLVRMKVSWPLSSREALIHYFAFEYFQDDLIVVLLNSISDSETIDRQTHGFTRDGIPNAEDVVRIDVVGGFALQKVTADRSYFRTIANMDIKLDFVPPAFINFISRQLVGSGFKLYKKEVASVSKGDQKFCEALKGPLYARIRKGLDHLGSSARSQNVENQRGSTSDMLEDQSAEASEDANAKDNSDVDSESKDVTFRERNELRELEELEETDTEGSEMSDDCTLKSSNCSTDENSNKSRPNKEVFASCTDKEEGLGSDEITESSRNEDGKKVLPISPNVEKALETLEKLISIFQEQRSRPSITGLNLSNLEKEAVEEAMPSEIDQISRNCTESSRIEVQNTTSVEPRISLDLDHASRQKASNTSKRETKHSKIAPASPDEGQSNSTSSALQGSMNEKTASIIVENDVESVRAKSAGVKTVIKSKNKKSSTMLICYGATKSIDEVKS